MVETATCQNGDASTATLFIAADEVSPSATDGRLTFFSHFLSSPSSSLPVLVRSLILVTFAVLLPLTIVLRSWPSLRDFARLNGEEI